jgi:hypothetical protein
MQRPPRAPATKTVAGVDIFVDSARDSAESIAAKLQPISKAHGSELVAIFNRGVQVWPGGLSETLASDSWRCRFAVAAGLPSIKEASQNLQKLVASVVSSGMDVSQTETLYKFDGKNGFSGPISK